MTTICDECKKEFKLDFYTVYIGSELEAPHDQVVVILCPHCKKRKEI